MGKDFLEKAGRVTFLLPDYRCYLKDNRFKIEFTSHSTSISDWLLVDLDKCKLVRAIYSDY